MIIKLFAPPIHLGSTMPIYLVKHPLLDVSLVRARNESELELMLDQLADPTLFEWREYKGPIWIDLRPPVKFEARYRSDKRPMTADEFSIGGMKELAQTGWELKPQMAETDEAASMEHLITKFAFPAVADLVEKSDLEQLDEKELERCLKEDLIAAAWRQSQRLGKFKREGTKRKKRRS